MSTDRFALVAPDAAATRAIAAAVATQLRLGDVVALSGDLGAGKTCFVQGAAAALGVTARVTSPTFVLVRQYEGRLPIVHADVYRLDTLQDVHDLGDDVLAPDVVTFLEWSDAVTPLLPDDRLEVELALAPDGASPAGTAAAADASGRAPAADPPRHVQLRLRGERWAAVADDVASAVAPWHAGGRG